MIRFLPYGMFTALFRPLPGEVVGAFGLVASSFNAILLVLFLLSIRRSRLYRFGRSPSLAWILMLLGVWSALYGFASAQNLGSGARFQLQILPVLWPLVLLGATRFPHRGLVPLRSSIAMRPPRRRRKLGSMAVTSRTMP